MELQFVEDMDEAASLVKSDGARLRQMQDTCDSWTRFQESHKIDQEGMSERGP
jgi:hypothetical protein